jgi:hypothetical protein
MNVKISIELSDEQKTLAEVRMRDHGFDSISDYFLSLMEGDVSAHDPVASIRDEIRARLELPKDQWLSEEEFDKGFDDLLRHADEQIKAGR